MLQMACMPCGRAGGTAANISGFTRTQGKPAGRNAFEEPPSLQLPLVLLD